MSEIWAGFLFKGLDPQEFYCAHASLGQWTPQKEVDATVRISQFFRSKLAVAIAPFKVPFLRIVALSPNRRIRALRPLSDQLGKFSIYEQLRKDLGKIHPPDWHPWNPYIATRAKPFAGTVDRYVLVSKGVIVLEVLLSSPREVGFQNE